VLASFSFANMPGPANRPISGLEIDAVR